jgi:hypothetical protein
MTSGTSPPVSAMIAATADTKLFAESAKALRSTDSAPPCPPATVGTGSCTLTDRAEKATRLSQNRRRPSIWSISPRTRASSRFHLEEIRQLVGRPLDQREQAGFEGARIAQSHLEVDVFLGDVARRQGEALEGAERLQGGRQRIELAGRDATVDLALVHPLNVARTRLARGVATRLAGEGVQPGEGRVDGRDLQGRLALPHQLPVLWHGDGRRACRGVLGEEGTTPGAGAGGDGAAVERVSHRLGLASRTIVAFRRLLPVTAVISENDTMQRRRCLMRTPQWDAALAPASRVTMTI